MSRVRMPPIAASSIITRPVTVVSSTGKEKSQHQYKQDVAHDRIRSKLFPAYPAFSANFSSRYGMGGV